MKITDKQLLCRIKQRCEEDFEFFVRYFFSLQHGAKFRFSWHHHEITKALMRVFTGETTHLIINMPPRYSKTELVVKMFTAWCFMKNPSCEFIHLSYSEALALDNSNAIRDLIKSQEFQQLWPIGLCKDAANAWKTTESGVFLARAAGGQVTGYGAGKVDDFEDGRGFCGCILIDDPLKPTDAHSETLRENINRRWDAVIKSRFNSPRTPCIVIMQRIHEEDFCGMLLKDEEYHFEQLILPAILDEGTDHERALWPEKHTLERLKAMASKNSYVFAGQYQQRPTPLGGGILKGAWFKRYTVAPKMKWRAVFVDTAQKEKESNDYQVAECWGLGEDNNHYLLDMFRDKFEAWELERRIPDFWAKQKADRRSPLRRLFVEDKSSGTELIQRITRGGAGRPRIPVQPIERSRSKLERVMDVQGFIQAGYVYLPDGAPFVNDFIAECEAFTKDDTHLHDDQIDPMCDAISQMLDPKVIPYSEML